MKKKLIKLKIITIFLTSLLTGCSDLVEVQDRDFVLALGVSIKADRFVLTFALPDLTALTNEGSSPEQDKANGQVRTYESISLTEIEDLYNHGSNKRLDYRHLEALILDESISASPDKLSYLFNHIENNYQISRNVRVFYYPEDVNTLIDSKGKISGNIGDYLKKLENNNQKRNDLPSVTIGNLIDSYSQQKGLLIPLIELKEDKLEVNGAAIFQGSVYVKRLTEQELNIYYVIKGQGKELNFYAQDDFVFKLNEFKSKTSYLYHDNKPIVQLSITGTAKSLSESNNDTNIIPKINDYLRNSILNQMNTCLKTDKVDYINLYDGSSIKNRKLWIDYQNRRNELIYDIIVEVDVDIKLQ